MIWVLVQLLLWSSLALVSGANDEIWIVVPKKISSSFSNYITYIESGGKMSNNVKIFDHLDTNIPTLFPNSRSFFNLEKLDPQMVSKIILLGASKISASWSAVELAHFVAIGGQLIIAMPDVKSSSSSFFKEFLSQFGVSFTKFPIVSERYESRQWNQELMDGVFEGNVPPALTYPNQTHGLLLDGNRSVNYLWSLITPEPTSLILNELNATPISCGAITSLIALFQSRYNGRLCVIPTFHMLCDEYFSERYFVAFMS